MGSVSLGRYMSEPPRLATANMITKAKALRAQGSTFWRIAQQVGCSTFAAGQIVDGKVGVGDVIPTERKMIAVETTCCTVCGYRVNKLPDGEMPCLPCRIRANM